MPYQTNFKLRRGYQALLICLVVLVVYYPTLSAEVCLLDDQSMLNDMLNAPPFDLKALFLPGSGGGGYYRPLIGLSYFFDRFAWGLSHEIMHFENILFHLSNSLLVFGIGCAVAGYVALAPAVPLLSALLFALHPLATESVNWISGRTDLLAGAFVFAAAFCVLRFPRRGILIPSLLLVIMGGLAKETAFAFIPGMSFLYRGMRSSAVTGDNAFHSRHAGITLAVGTLLALVSAVLYFNYIFIAVLVLVLALYLTLERGAASKGTAGIGTLLAYTSLVMAGIAVFWALRRLAFASDMPKIATALKLLTADVNTTIHFFLGAVGFYAKKVIWPLPLDFAIVSIDPLYSLLGVVLVVLSVYLVVRPSMGSGLLLAALFLVMPALPLTMGRVAWTPYAERYVYLALPFVILAVGGACSTLIKGRVVIACGVSILLVYAVCTTQRNLVWQKNLTLFADMVEKSPNFKPARGLYMVALYNRSHFDRAAEQYYIAQSLPSVLYDEEFDLVMAGMLSEQKKYHEAEAIYLKAVNKTKERNPKVLWALTTFYLSEYFRSADSGEKLRIKIQVLECLEKIQIADNAPMTLYRISQIYLSLGETERARLMLRGASKSLKDSDQAKVKITRLLSQLEK